MLLRKSRHRLIEQMPGLILFPPATSQVAMLVWIFGDWREVFPLIFAEIPGIWEYGKKMGEVFSYAVGPKTKSETLLMREKLA